MGKRRPRRHPPPTLQIRPPHAHIPAPPPIPPAGQPPIPFIPRPPLRHPLSTWRGGRGVRFLFPTPPTPSVAKRPSPRTHPRPAAHTPRRAAAHPFYTPPAASAPPLHVERGPGGEVSFPARRFGTPSPKQSRGARLSRGGPGGEVSFPDAAHPLRYKSALPTHTSPPRRPLPPPGSRPSLSYPARRFGRHGIT